MLQWIEDTHHLALALREALREGLALRCFHRLQTLRRYEDLDTLLRYAAQIVAVSCFVKSVRTIAHTTAPVHLRHPLSTLLVTEQEERTQ